MATNGKPTTRFTVTYGDLPAESAGGSLIPVIVAPRYAVHKATAGYAGAEAGLYDINNTADGSKIYAFPDYQGGVIDKNGCKMFARNAMIVLPDNTITGTLDTDYPTLIKTSKTVRPVSDYPIVAGDKVKVTVSGQNVVGRIIDVLPTYTTEEPKVVTLATGETVEVAIDDLVAKPEQDIAYLIRVVSKNGDSVKFEARAILGDTGYYNVFDAVTADAPMSIGEFGITPRFTSEQLRGFAVGDSLIVKAFAEKAGAYDNIYVDVDLSGLGNTEAATLEFYKKSPINTLQVKTQYWDIVDATVKALDIVRVQIADKSYRVAEAEMVVEYRELITDDANILVSSSGNNASVYAGVFDPENPMGFAYTVFKAVSSSFGGATAYMIAVDEDSDAGYQRAIERAGRYEDAYAFVPISGREAVKNFVKSTIAQYSRPEVAQFKCGWLTSGVKQSTVVMDKDSNGAALIATIANNTLTLVAGDIIEAGIKEGDTVVVIGGASAATVSTEQTFKFVRAINSLEAKIVGYASTEPIVGAIRFERKLSSTEYAKAVAEEAAAINNYRIKLIAADQVNYGGFVDVDKAYLAVACAAMRAALPPHAPLTDRVLDGFTITEKVSWTDADLETMNYGGAWVVYNDIDGAVKNYHQITTRTDGSIAEEDSVVSNGDAIVRELRTAIRPLAGGSSNASLAVIGAIEAKVHAVMAAIAARSYSAELGPQFEDYAILALYRPEGNRQRIIGNFSITGPLPLQDGEFTFNLI